eukprot:GCRY01000705.1.p1 GENE.GCRY01000705.1~~GCRY01000705.1.p1  ORF type:complete len:209 (-),score=24.07 GCRY01000705.1:273-899(-)
MSQTVPFSTAPSESSIRARGDSISTANEDGYLLENCWTFWFEKGETSGGSDYSEKQLKICDIRTVKGFWEVFNHLPIASRLAEKSSFHLMKTGVNPLWEDPANAEGGSYIIRVHKSDVDYVWRELLLAVIGEQLDEVPEGDTVNGITVGMRPNDCVFQLWNRNASLQRDSVFTKMESLLKEIAIRNRFYKAHNDHAAFSTPPARRKNN